MAAGMVLEFAQRAAVESFGNADSVADEVLEEATNARSKRLGKLLVLGATIGLFVMMGWIAFSGFEPGLTLACIAVAIPLAVAFCRGSVLAHRPLSAHISLIALAGTLAVVLLLPYGFAIHNGAPASRLWLEVDQRMMAPQIVRLDAAADGLTSGLAYYRALAAANGDQSKVKGRAPRDRDGFYLKLPQYWGYDPGQLGIVKTADQAHMIMNVESEQESVALRPAMDDWLTRGPAMLAQSKRQIGYTMAASAAIQAALARPFGYSRTGILCAGAAGGGVLLGLVTLNADSLGVARRLRRRRTRRPVLA